jgi:glycosyltransferase involved in cell wall biosynthesis
MEVSVQLSGPGANLDGKRISVSFVVPALNEEKVLPGLVESISRVFPDHGKYEIIVVDNGSSDATVERAREAGATTLERPGATVAHLRNEGVRLANGEIIVFLDADVRLLTGWYLAFQHLVDRIRVNPNIISGAPLSCPPDASWIAKAWGDFSHRMHRLSHIGSGQMILHRQVFLHFGGFDSTLTTGEDFDLCRRAKDSGFLLQPDPGLAAMHTRLPKSLGDFVRREIWHGSGDASTLRTVIRSSVMIGALVFTALHILLLILLVIRPAGWPGGIIVVLGSIAGLCFAGAVRRAGVRPGRLLVGRFVLVYVYFWARSISLGRAVWLRLRSVGNGGKAAVTGRGW